MGKNDNNEKKRPPSELFHYMIVMGWHLLICVYFLILADLLTSKSMPLVLNIIAFKSSIFNLSLDLNHKCKT